ncbi:pyrroloquinoline quinone biosynthesis protein PqqE [Catelliglobosispora koreensis]|uniref:pyrroloquinoline quinone biosynthesis protein PqqE n=1 Tax=Catelliglobosispora koreensis TaxID=129052 RepID=UPI00036116F2|nr:pyrroloquinoline quinone biosynthesis protein PqqE [Catelliglobosispora koreensis]
MNGPRLRGGVRFVFDEARQQHAVLQPEGVQLLNEAAAAVLSYCDGQHDAAAITASLGDSFDGVTPADVEAALDSLSGLGILTAGEHLVGSGHLAGGRHTSSGRETQAHGGGAPVRAEVARAGRAAVDPAPFGLLAELTYRCPLRCPYCSNPVDMDGAELSTSSWSRVFAEARDLGVLQLHLSGGEPLARKDLTELVASARQLSLYTNLITSGIGLTESRLSELKQAGLDHVQLSIQDADAPNADAIAGIRVHERKRAVAKLVTASGLPLSINVVLHRHNVTRLTEIAALATEMGAQRLELAHTQYYGWGLLNRAALLPTREEVAIADEQAAQILASKGDIDIVYVRPDYYDGVPKPCMNGWGARQLVVNPSGDVLPCPAASVIPELDSLNVLDVPLKDIWYHSGAFNKFRGVDWMQEPCRTCPRKEIDFGGCRCQAFQLTGDAAATDPACALSPKHEVVTTIVGQRAALAFTPRRIS